MRSHKSCRDRVAFHVHGAVRSRRPQVLRAASTGSFASSILAATRGAGILKQLHSSAMPAALVCGSAGSRPRAAAVRIFAGKRFYVLHYGESLCRTQQIIKSRHGARTQSFAYYAQQILIGRAQPRSVV